MNIVQGWVLLLLLCKFVCFVVEGLHILKADSEAPYFDASAIDEAFRDNGILIIEGWNTSVLLRMNSALEGARDLFTSKQKMDTLLTQAVPTRGYIPEGQESGQVGKVYEPKEGFSFGWPGTEKAGGDSPLLYPNVWPKDTAQQTIDALEGMFVLCSQVADAVTAVLPRAPVVGPGSDAHDDDDDDDDGDSKVDTHDGDPSPGARGPGRTKNGKWGTEGGKYNSLLRLFHYMPTAERFGDDAGGGESMGSETILGSSPHTDWGFLTVILQDEVGGLQIRGQEAGGGANGAQSDGGDDAWVNVPARPGSLVVICGDMLRTLTGNAYVSPVHRVVAPQYTHRYSFVYFFYPELSERLPPVPSRLVERARDERRSGGDYNTLYDSVDANCSADKMPTFGDYIIGKWRGVHREHANDATEL